MRYLPKSDHERGEMLAALGLSNVEELVSYLPGDVRFDGRLPIENGKSEVIRSNHFIKTFAIAFPHPVCLLWETLFHLLHNRPKYGILSSVSSMRHCTIFGTNGQVCREE